MYSPVGVVVFGRDGEVVELKAEVPLPGDSVKRIERLGERAERASLTSAANWSARAASDR
jgi:hypothetical protein